jgi:hypothetical protein
MQNASPIPAHIITDLDAASQAGDPFNATVTEGHGRSLQSQTRTRPDA